MRLHLSAATLAISAAALPRVCDGQVVVHQVETSESQDEIKYAPVSFPTGPTVTRDGVTYRALAETGAVQSAHAEAVAGYLVGEGSVSRGIVSEIHIDRAERFIEQVLKPQETTRPNGPLPQPLSPAIDLSVHAWVSTTGSAEADRDAVRRFDHLLVTQGITGVAGAVVSDAEPFLNTNLLWSAHNVIAVRGSSGSTPFELPGAQLSRAHVDVWSDGLSSFATARVGSFAAGIIHTARERGLSDADRPVVVKSLLMTGAEKAGVLGWTDDTPNHLDMDAGAGKANYLDSVGLIDGGRRSLAVAAPSGEASMTVTDLAVTPNQLRGWAHATIEADQTRAVVFQTTGEIGEVTATLVWNVTHAATATTIDTTDAGMILPDLSLELRPVTLTDGVYHIGPSTGDAMLLSDIGDDPATPGNENDNVEHVYVTTRLPAGYWALVVGGDADHAAEVGLSYRVRAEPEARAIPEPVGPLAALLAGGWWVLHARRRRA